MDLNPLKTTAELYNSLAHVIFPDCCLGCNQVLVSQEEAVCTSCLYEIAQTGYHLHTPNPLEQKFWGKVQLSHAFAFVHFQKGGRVQRLLHALKYKGKEDVGQVIGRIYGGQLKDAGYAHTFDVIVPVPLHKKRLKQRGYNQSESFAQALAEALSATHQPYALKRVKATATQTRKSRLDRWLNMELIFEAGPQATDIKGKRVLLVDDVITTGATLEACALKLIECGAATVSVAAIATA